MIGAAISRWLNANGSFLEGMGYCQQVNPAAHTRLMRWNTAPLIPPEIKEQLRDALRAHAASAPDPALSTGDPRGRPLLSTAIPAAPPEIQALHRQARTLHKQYAELKARLGILTAQPDLYTNADRYAIAREIMEDVLPATDDIYEKIRAYENTGALPASGSNALKREVVAQYEQLLSLRPRISRVRKWLADGAWPRKSGVQQLTETDRAELEKELAEKLALVQELEIELGIDG
jgi:hypothetical protein